MSRMLSSRSYGVHPGVSFSGPNRSLVRGRRRRIRPGARAVAETTSIDSAVDSAVDLVKLSGETLKRLVELEGDAEKVQSRFKTAFGKQCGQYLNAKAPMISETVEKLTPLTKRVTRLAADVSSSIVTAASPAVKSAAQAAKDALTDRGIDVSDVQSTTLTIARALSDATVHGIRSSVTFLTTTEPGLLGYYALGALGLYLFGPALLSNAAEAFRGYAGDVSPAGALDIVISKSNAYLIDIRTEAEKERLGLLDIPNRASNRLIELEFASIKDDRLRRQLNDPSTVECRITALQIAALKRLNRGSNVFLLDANGSVSKRIAKELSRLGFGRCHVIEGGFAGWIKAKLQTKMSMVVSPEVIQPSIFRGTIERIVPTSDQKSLPPGKQS